MRKTLFADVLLPLPVDGYFTYRVPFELNDMMKPGIRVAVQFGKKKLYTALVRKIHEKPPMVVPKYILAVLDDEPIVNDIQFRFWEWMADYYMCTPGEVMSAALPPGFKLASETRVILDPANTSYEFTLNEKEQLVITALQAREILTLGEVSELVGQLKVIPLIKTMIEKGLLLTEDSGQRGGVDGERVTVLDQDDGAGLGAVGALAQSVQPLRGAERGPVAPEVGLCRCRAG